MDFRAVAPSPTAGRSPSKRRSQRRSVNCPPAAPSGGASKATGPDGSRGGTGNGSSQQLKRRPISVASMVPPINGGQMRFSLPRMPDSFYRYSQNSRLYKVIVVGEIHSGKSALIRRYVHDFYSQNYCATIGVDFRLKLIHYNDDLEIRLQLWDIAGQERFSSMTRAYYKGTMGAIIVFDYTNANTYQAAIDRWKKDLDDKCCLPGNRPVPAILVANKCDLRRDKSLPDDLEISRVVQERGFVPRWFKCSAKTGENVVDAMNLVVRYIMTLDTWSQSRSGGRGGGAGVGSGSDEDDLSTSSNVSQEPSLFLHHPPRNSVRVLSEKNKKIPRKSKPCWCQ